MTGTVENAISHATVNISCQQEELVNYMALKISALEQDLKHMTLLLQKRNTGSVATSAL